MFLNYLVCCLKNYFKNTSKKMFKLALGVLGCESLVLIYASAFLFGHLKLNVIIWLIFIKNLGPANNFHHYDLKRFRTFQRLHLLYVLKTSQRPLQPLHLQKLCLLYVFFKMSQKAPGTLFFICLSFLVRNI